MTVIDQGSSCKRSTCNPPTLVLFHIRALTAVLSSADSSPSVIDITQALWLFFVFVFFVLSCLNEAIMNIYVRATKKKHNEQMKPVFSFFVCFFLFSIVWNGFRTLENTLAFQMQPPYPSNSSSNKTKLYLENEYWLFSSIPDLFLWLILNSSEQGRMSATGNKPIYCKCLWRCRKLHVAP